MGVAHSYSWHQWFQLHEVQPLKELHGIISYSYCMPDWFVCFSCLFLCFVVCFMQLTHLLKPGEAMTFNNRRFLHSRNAFKSNGGIRHLQVLT